MYVPESKPVEITETFTPSGASNSHPLTLDALKWAIETFDPPEHVNLPDLDDLSEEEIFSIKSFYSSPEKIIHYDNLQDLLKKLKK